MLQTIDVLAQDRHSISLLAYSHCLHYILMVYTNTRNGFHIWYSDILTSNVMKNLQISID
jgi:hypothetical protein